MRIFVFSRNLKERIQALELGASWSGAIQDEPPEPMAAAIDATPAWLPMIAAMRHLIAGGRLVVNSIRKEDVDKGEPARDAGAAFVVFGSFTQFGQGASLDLQCASVADDAGDGRRIFVQSGTLGEVIPKLDELAEKIHVHVSGGIRASAAAAAAAPGGSDLANLESRVEALERTVFRTGPEQGPSAPPAPKAPAGGGGGRPR